MVKGLNEHKIIEIIIEIIGQPKAHFSKIGDDVAYLPSKNKKVVIKSDMLVEKTDIPKNMNLFQAARKSIVMCISDFAAKGVIPTAALTSLGIPKGTSENEIRELALGFKKAKEEFQIEILGGDTNEADCFIIDCFMIGFADNIIERRGAKPGDVVVTSGYFGYSSSGLKILIDNLKAEPIFMKKATTSVLMPNPKLKLGVALASKKVMSASIDSSDGLALSLYEIALNSKVGIELTKLPKSDELNLFSDMNNLNVNDLVLYGGEEYDIVATIPKHKLEEAYKIAKKVGENLIVIGNVIDDYPKVYLSYGTDKNIIERKGWIHLR